MGRAPRVTEPGTAYHVLNRRVMRLRLFSKAADYRAFETVLAESLLRPDAPTLLTYCLMPSHWHLVVQAGEHTDLSTWVQWLTVTHTHRWHAHTDSAGEGPLYQGRFKSFPVQKSSDTHFLVLCRYVEANALRAGLVSRAEEWPWSAVRTRDRRNGPLADQLGRWPVERPRDWLAELNQAMSDEDIALVRQAVRRGTPLGKEPWRVRIAGRLGLDLTMRPRGRPRKEKSS